MLIALLIMTTQYLKLMKCCDEIFEFCIKDYIFKIYHFSVGVNFNSSMGKHVSKKR